MLAVICEGRGKKKTSSPDLIACRGPESLSDAAALVPASRFAQPRVLAMGELWEKADLDEKLAGRH